MNPTSLGTTKGYPSLEAQLDHALSMANGAYRELKDLSARQDAHLVDHAEGAVQTTVVSSSEPTSPQAGMLWMDTSEGILKVRNYANSSWLDCAPAASPDSHVALTLATPATALLSLAGQQLNLGIQGPGLVFAGPSSGGAGYPAFRALVNADLGTSLSPTFDTLHVTNGIAGGSLIVDTSTLVVDAVNHRVGVLAAAPSVALDVGGTIRSFSATSARLTLSHTGANGGALVITNDGNNGGNTWYFALGGDQFLIKRGSADRFVITDSTWYLKVPNIYQNVDSAAVRFGAVGAGSTLVVLSGNVQAATMSSTGAVTIPISLTATGLATFNGGVTVANGTDLTLSGVLASDVIPKTTFSYSLGSINKKYLALHAAELWVETLVASGTLATIGGRILVGPTDELAAALGGAAGDTTITVKRNTILASGDRIYLETNGKVEFMAVTSGPSGTGPYTYTVTRNLDGTGLNAWDAGDAVFNTGTINEGFIDIYSIQSMKPGSTQYGPTIVGNIRNSATYNDWNEAWAIGNLYGLYGYSGHTYGVGLGKHAAGKAHVTVDPDNGFRIFSGTATVVGQWAGDGTITIGEVGAGKDNIVISAGALSVRNNTTERIGLTTGGVLTVKNSSGGAVFTLDASAGAEFTLPLTLGAGGGIYQGTGTFAAPTTGLKLWNDGGVGRIGGYNTGSIQWYANSDGKLYAGAGAVILDGGGIAVAVGAMYTNYARYSFVDATTPTTSYGGLQANLTAGVLSPLWQFVAPASSDLAWTIKGTVPAGQSGALTINQTISGGVGPLLQLYRGTQGGSPVGYTRIANYGLHVGAAVTTIAEGVLDCSAGFTANTSAGDNDSRIGGDTQANLFYVDAGSDRVGIMTGTPAYRLTIGEAITAGQTLFSVSPVATATAGAGLMFSVAYNDNYSGVLSTGAELVNGAWQAWHGEATILLLSHGQLGWYSNSGLTAGGTTFTATQRASFRPGAAMLCIGTDTDWVASDFTNAYMTSGITLHQGAADNEILCFQSSDVAHTRTDQTATDTFGFFKKTDGATGGLRIMGLSEATIGLELLGHGATEDSTRGTGGIGQVCIRGFKNAAVGNNVGDMSANQNILVVRNNATTRFILDTDGDSHQDVGTAWTNFDDVNDVAMLHALSAGVARQGDPVREMFAGFLTENRALLEGSKLVTFNPDGHHFVNMSKLLMLAVGAIRQQAARLDTIERRLLN